MKNILKNWLFVAVAALTCNTISAQDVPVD